jgi:hypothetical protein
MAAAVDEPADTSGRLLPPFDQLAICANLKQSRGIIHVMRRDYPGICKSSASARANILQRAFTVESEMSIRTLGALLGVATLIGAVHSVPAEALSLKECSVKYKEAQAAGTLNGRKWAEFRKAECGATAAATTAPAPATTPPAAAPKAATAPASAAPASAAVFPTAVSPKYSSEKPGRARMHTCLDQYRANKAGNANGGMRWIQKGGGYYSECNKRLRG